MQRRRNKHNCTIQWILAFSHTAQHSTALHMWPTWDGQKSGEEKKQQNSTEFLFAKYTESPCTFYRVLPPPHDPTLPHLDWMMKHNMKRSIIPQPKGWDPPKKREEINKDGQFYHFTLYTQHRSRGRRKEGGKEDAEHIKHIKLHVHDYIDLRK